MNRATGYTGAVRRLALMVVLGLAALGSLQAGAASAAGPTSVDLSTYDRVGRFDLPEPTRTTAPPNSLLAQEASSVTYDWDTDTLFVVGDGGTSVVQVTKTGQLIDSMTLPPGGSPQGTEFYDTEGITYVGAGKFVLVEERDRQANLFTYVAGGTLHRADAQTVKLGTTIGNIGLEGVTWDPFSGGFVFVKEMDPEGIFQTNIDWNAHTATNGSPTTENSVNLFDSALAGLLDFSDVFSLSNLPSLTGQPDFSHLLVISQASGKIEELDRTGHVDSSLTILSDPGNPLSVPDQTHEGVTMDRDGILYTVSEDGGGDVDHPQLWVYAHSTAADQAPTGLVLTHQLNSIPETTSTAARVKLADVVVADDGLGTNNLSVTGPDASSFEVDNTGLYLKAGTILKAATKSSYDVTVQVDDPSVGATPDATATFHLVVTPAGSGPPAGVFISEVSPWSSGNTPYAADWFELTNAGSQPMPIVGWRMDDNSNSAGSAVDLHGVTTIGPGRSAVFIEGDATTAAAFESAWFGSSIPAGFQIGFYSGPGVGLSTGGDAVNIFDTSGNRITGIQFGNSTTNFTFDNTAGAGSTTLPLPTISTLSARGVNGAFVASDGQEIGSPGTTTSHVAITEVAPWASGNSPYMADWFEVTNTGTLPVDLTKWAMDDNSNAFANAVPLRGVPALAPGGSAIFMEGVADGSTDAVLRVGFANAWFGSPNIPVGFLIGNYGGSGVGLSTSTDAVNLFDGAGTRITGVQFAASTTGVSFDNIAGIGGTTLPLPVISTLSTVGVNHAFKAADGIEIGSPFFETAPPVILATATPSANAKGWNRTDVTVSYSCTDSGVGVDTAASSLGSDVLSASGTASGTCVDRVGNSATATYTAKIDKAPPTFGPCPAAGPFALGSGTHPVGPIAASDALSGIDAGASTLSGSVDASASLGPKTVTFTAADLAGNTATASCIYVVSAQSTLAALRDELNAASAGTALRSAMLTASAARQLDAALDPSLWVDANHLATKGGKKSFEDVQTAVKRLVELQKEDDVLATLAQGWIDRMVAVERALAQTALDDATASGSDPEALAAAAKALRNGDRHQAADESAQAVTAYENAWQDAVGAV